MDGDGLFFLLSKLLPQLVFPLTLACALVLASLFVSRRARLGRALAVCALILLWAASCTPVSRGIGRSLEWQYLPQTDYPKADAIVLLGGTMRAVQFPRQRPSLGDSADRILEAALLFEQGKAPRIHIAAGRLDWRGTLGPEAPDVAAVLEELGVPASALILDEESRNTHENAVIARRMLEPLGVKRILLVTSALHMPRAVGLFRHEGFDVIAAPADIRAVAWSERAGLVPDDLREVLVQSIPDAETLAYTTGALREWLGIAFYRSRGLME